MTTNANAFILSAQNHGDGIPAQEFFYPFFQLDITRIGWLAIRRDGVSVRGVESRLFQRNVSGKHVILQAAQHLAGTLSSVLIDNGIKGLRPFRFVLRQQFSKVCRLLAHRLSPAT